MLIDLSNPDIDQLIEALKESRIPKDKQYRMGVVCHQDNYDVVLEYCESQEITLSGIFNLWLSRQADLIRTKKGRKKK